MEAINIINYSVRGKSPYLKWRDTLDTKTRSIVLVRIARIRLGNWGDCKPIKNGNGIRELRIDYGPGYRIYFGKKGSNLVIILVGGSKGSQTRDIEKARQYWQEYKEESSND